jgi:hypothetical protein
VENGYDYAGQDPVNGYDLSGAVEQAGEALEGAGDIGAAIRQIYEDGCGDVCDPSYTPSLPDGLKVAATPVALGLVGAACAYGAEFLCVAGGRALFGVSIANDAKENLLEHQRPKAFVAEAATALAFYGVDTGAVSFLKSRFDSALAHRNIELIAAPTSWLVEQIWAWETRR